MANELVPMNEMHKMAQVFASSKMFGCKTPDEAMAIMLLAQSEGLHPATAARDYHIIQGRPAMKADAMLTRYLQSGGKVKWLCYTDTKVEAEFSHPAGGSVTIDWTQDRAKQAGLTGKDNWKHYPRQMLRARVISEGVRTTNPGVAVGIYSEAEVEDMVRVEKDMGAADVVVEPSSPRAAGGNPPPSEPLPPSAASGSDPSRMLAAFATLGVPDAELVAHLGKPLTDLSDEDMAKLRAYYKQKSAPKQPDVPPPDDWAEDYARNAAL